MKALVWRRGVALGAAGLLVLGFALLLMGEHGCIHGRSTEDALRESGTRRGPPFDSPASAQAVLRGPASSPQEAEDASSRPDPPDSEAAHLRGFVVDVDNEPVGAGIQVRGHCWELPQRGTASAVTDSSGAFRLSLDAVIPATSAYSIGVAARDDVRGLVSRPSRIHDAAIPVVLVLRSASRIRVAVTRADGVPAPGARVLLSSYGRTRGGAGSRYPESPGIVDRVERADSAGLLATLVRPGFIRIRAATEHGPWGDAVEARVPAGGPTHLGVVSVGTSGVRCTVVARDALSGKPVKDAWLRVSDRAAYVGAEGALYGVPHYQTDASGRVILPPIARENLPLSIAVGSAAHQVTGVTLDERCADREMLDIALEPRMSFRLVVTPADLGETVSSMCEWAVSRVDARQLSLHEFHASLPPGPTRPLRMFLSRPHVVPGTASGVFRVFVPSAGDYEVRCAVAGGVTASARCRIHEGEEEPQAILELPPGRLVRVEIAPSRAVSPGHVRTWPFGPVRIVSKRSRGVPLEYVVDVDGEGRGQCKLWLPWDVGTIELHSVDGMHVPWAVSAGSVEAGDEVVRLTLDVPSEGDAGLLVTTLGDDEQPWPLDGVEVSIRRVDPQGVYRTGRFRGRTDSAGEFRVWLPPGTYEARARVEGVGASQRRRIQLVTGQESVVQIPMRAR